MVMAGVPAQMKVRTDLAGDGSWLELGPQCEQAGAVEAQAADGAGRDAGAGDFHSRWVGCGFSRWWE
jgi:hypothetical protein